jgi:hypothetical protein
MRQLLYGAGLLCAAAGIAGWAMGQNGSMPGQVAGTSSGTTPTQGSSGFGEQLKTIGKVLPRLGKPVGTSATRTSTNPLLQPYNPNDPYGPLVGAGLNVNSVVAPANGHSTEVPQSTFQQIATQMKSLVGMSTPPKVQPTFTPGIYRRDRQRVQARMWVRD